VVFISFEIYSKLLFQVLMSKNDDGSSYEEFIMDHLPWLTGSLGTVALDFTVSS